ncbi:MAG TPA: hypothetical protein VK875_12870 [Euzebyales bacterium]|nr:hypothetical protein [Euzebyales bacterium]
MLRPAILIALGAVIVAVAAVLIVMEPVPVEAGLREWLAAGERRLAWADELLFFGILCWGAGATALCSRPRERASLGRRVGTTALVVALAALLIVLLAIGRLVYPISDHSMSDDALTLLVDTTFGALHLAMLGFGVSAIALTGLSAGDRVRPLRVIVGCVLGIAFIAGSFPWLTPTWWNVSAAVLLGAWGLLLASAANESLLERSEPPTVPGGSASVGEPKSTSPTEI